MVRRGDPPIHLLALAVLIVVVATAIRVASSG